MQSQENTQSNYKFGLTVGLLSLLTLVTFVLGYLESIVYRSTYQNPTMYVESLISGGFGLALFAVGAISFLCAVASAFAWRQEVIFLRQYGPNYEW